MAVTCEWEQCVTVRLKKGAKIPEATLYCVIMYCNVCISCVIVNSNTMNIFGNAVIVLGWSLI